MQDLGIKVSLIDNNPTHVRHAQEEGLDARKANVLSETVLDEIDLYGLGRLLITIPNDEVASLAALHFSDVFDSTDIYQLAAGPESRHGSEGAMPKHLRGRPLFGENTNFESLKEHAARGNEVHILRLTEAFADEEKQDYYRAEDLSDQDDEHTIVPLFLLSVENDLEVVSELDQFRMRPEDRLLALVGPKTDEQTPSRERPSTDGDHLPEEDSIFEVVELREEDGDGSAQ